MNNSNGLCVLSSQIVLVLIVQLGWNWNCYGSRLGWNSRPHQTKHQIQISNSSRHTKQEHTTKIKHTTLTAIGCECLLLSDGMHFFCSLFDTGSVLLRRSLAKKFGRSLLTQLQPTVDNRIHHIPYIPLHTTLTMSSSFPSSFIVPSTSRLHGGYSHPLLREWHSQPMIQPSELVYPIFIHDLEDEKHEIKSLPEQYRWGVNLSVGETPLR